MFAFTVDQVDSRHTADAVDSETTALRERYGAALLLGPDRTAGDEFQVLVADPAVALDVVLRLTRTGRWSVGLGIGTVDAPLPPTTREATGPAFVLARRSIDAAKSTTAQHRFALRADVAADSTPVDAAGVLACIDLVLAVRAHRTEAGWEVADMLAGGGTQIDAAKRLGITPQAVSLRVRAAELRSELAALPLLATVLGALEAAAVGAGS